MFFLNIAHPYCRGAAHRLPTIARSSTAEPPIAHAVPPIADAVPQERRDKKYAGTVPFGKLSLKYFLSRRS